MLTFFTIPKAFEGHTALIQLNAIRSWMKASPSCEIILCGDDPGVEDAAREHSLTHLPGIQRNAYGTPLLNSAFDLVQQTARHRYVCYINTDIILTTDLASTLAMIPFERFLMVGQRWDMDVRASIDFGVHDWMRRLQEDARSHGSLHPPTGSDYFAFPRGTIGDLPAFAVGRPGWDNWFIYHARALGLPVIDATGAVTIIHQNHGYTHVPGKRENAWEGPEGDLNRELMGGRETVFTIHDATWLLGGRGLKRALSSAHLKRILPAMSALHPRFRMIHGGFAFLLSLPGRASAALFHRLSRVFKQG